MAHVLKWSLALLLAIVVLGLVFAFLPQRAEGVDRTGVQLRDVSLRLYPAQDPDAEWRFQAPSLSFDPVKGEATISGLEQGERWARDPQTGQLGLDLTLSTQELTIDANDNIHTRKANIYLPRDCWALSLDSTDQQSVLIDQNRGISAPFATISSPAVNGAYDNVTVGFNLSGFNATQHEGTTFATAPDQVCEGGRLVSRTRR